MNIEDLHGMAIIAGAITFIMVFMAVCWRTFGGPRGYPHEVWRKGHHIGFGLASLLTRESVVDGTGAAIVIALPRGLVIALTETASPFGLDHITVPLMTAVMLSGLRESGQGAFVTTGEGVIALALLAGSA